MALRPDVLSSHALSEELRRSLGWLGTAQRTDQCVQAGLPVGSSMLERTLLAHYPGIQLGAGCMRSTGNHSTDSGGQILLRLDPET